MKYTIIPPEDSQLLENLIVKYGQIVSAEQIFSEAKTASLVNRQIIYLISKLVKNGWLVRIKKGLYFIADLGTRGSLPLSPHVVANLLEINSYVSFEAALHHHGMFDQLTNKIISVSSKMHKTVKLQNIEYSFIKTKTEYFFGWEEISMNGKTANIATAEKALVDMVNFHKSSYSIDLVIEKLREHKDNLNFERLNKYAGKMSMTTIKIFGFIFDLLGIDSSELFGLAKLTKSAHKMVSDSKIFNSKWRLYYNAYFDKYKL